ncbi:winged helix-turn-helix domain-containing protein [Kibdelosporangium aridum]|uniref:Regulatory protein, gntR family n=1 Tax=Kibdelosporangium aridum TaxID=2030 RepID=A0A1W2EY07_KIBAR|nr:GntR family transcriptional regulator [Kibdelosporangium aridum]SMD14106.1 regulatory protein, gntR family [Kibdelosporangium aridum]
MVLPRALYERVADDLAARITFGDIPPGTWLPGERDLAREYAVSPQTVHKAVGLLFEWRLVRTVRTKGALVLSLHE